MHVCKKCYDFLKKESDEIVYTWLLICSETSSYYFPTLQLIIELNCISNDSCEVVINYLESKNYVITHEIGKTIYIKPKSDIDENGEKIYCMNSKKHMVV